MGLKGSNPFPGAIFERIGGFRGIRKINKAKEKRSAASIRATISNLPAVAKEDTEEIIRNFKEFCEIDLRLMKRTVRLHVGYIRRFLSWVGRAPNTVNDQDIRNFLSMFKENSPRTYANNLISLRRFFRDFLQKDQVIKSFRLPEGSPLRPKIVPTKERLREFYEALESTQYKAMFLMFATSGLRAHELLEIRLKDVDFERRMILPQNEGSRTKRTWVTFFNEEAEQTLKQYLATCKDLTPESRLFPSEKAMRLAFGKAKSKSGIHITPQVLREWFCQTFGELGIPDRFIDSFVGRVPRSVLAQYYSDYTPGRLKEIYDRAGLKVLS